MGGPGMGMAGAMMQQMRGMSGGMAGGMGGAQGPGMMQQQMRGMAGGMGGMYAGAGGASADLKKEMTTLTRTDFLIQFVWQYKPEENPKTDEERNEKLKKIITDFTEAQKKNPAVKISEDIQKELDAASRKKSEQFDAKLKAPGPDNAAAAVPGGAVLPGANAPGAAVPKTGGP